MGAGAQTGNTQRKLNKTKKHWRRIDTTSSARRGNSWGCLIQTSSVDPRPKNKHGSFSDEKFRSADQRSRRCTHTDCTHISSSAVKQSHLPTQLSLNNLLTCAWLFEQMSASPPTARSQNLLNAHGHDSTNWHWQEHNRICPDTVFKSPAADWSHHHS